jgi:hypothetical protein
MSFQNGTKSRRPRVQATGVAGHASVADAEVHVLALILGEVQTGLEITREQRPSASVATM